MDLAERIANAFDRYVFDDNLSFKFRDNSWSFYRIAIWLSVNYMDEDRNRAEYFFNLSSEKEGEIVIANHHRMSWNQGFGTKTLRTIEGGLFALAQRREMPVRLIFEDCLHQPDTVRWLEKNEYSQNRDGTYEKIFVPS